jgi:hypothetical protein
MEKLLQLKKANCYKFYWSYISCMLVLGIIRGLEYQSNIAYSILYQYETSTERGYNVWINI